MRKGPDEEQALAAQATKDASAGQWRAGGLAGGREGGRQIQHFGRGSGSGSGSENQNLEANEWNRWAEAISISATLHFVMPHPSGVLFNHAGDRGESLGSLGLRLRPLWGPGFVASSICPASRKLDDNDLGAYVSQVREVGPVFGRRSNLLHLCLSCTV
ncbi:hypothetical protein AXG93_2035s1070 [Marchantia polymorpha subsp. ruderalis]|uniref:Uncharacterized protein n=1 Tax=Marchantia polymorpha subsp. ruderalis TaxID=1480154 RepID=A0A176VS94_MARPO|nr:hypothetical protein AXG93_2035s1070 [Marchantia polymorpha subsp. ruderalis]